MTAIINSYTRILVVDDFEMVRNMLRTVLSELSLFDVKNIDNGEAAWFELEKANKEHRPFGLVFLDWNMPRMSGIELLQKLRNDSRFHEVPVIMVTAEGDSKQVVKAIADGANDYIVKPFSSETVRKKIDRLNKVLGKPTAS